MYKTSILLVTTGALALAGCMTTDPETGERRPARVINGAIIGAGIGAVAGAATNTSDSEQTRRNAIIGAGIGAIAGAAVGDYMNDQERKLREEMRGRGVDVQRTAENEITLVMPAGITFDYDRADVKPEFINTLGDVVDTLVQYPSTTIDVIGHTDSRGSDDYNQNLSERRASAVASVLMREGVQSQRVITVGAGERSPKADNGTDAGRAANRRVEIKLRPITA
jgi:outer membrane protein OmpA-like peptidoglycan-associated protein